jgi:hypothetical protein
MFSAVGGASVDKFGKAIGPHPIEILKTSLRVRFFRFK